MIDPEFKELREMLDRRQREQIEYIRGKGHDGAHKDCIVCEMLHVIEIQLKRSQELTVGEQGR